MVDDVAELKEAVVRLVHAAQWVLGEANTESLDHLQMQVDIGKKLLRETGRRASMRKGAKAKLGN